MKDAEMTALVIILYVIALALKQSTKRGKRHDIEKNSSMFGEKLFSAPKKTIGFVEDEIEKLQKQKETETGMSIYERAKARQRIKQKLDNIDESKKETKHSKENLENIAQRSIRENHKSNKPIENLNIGKPKKSIQTEYYKEIKGREYEYQILRFFQSKDYKVYPKGYIEGKNDEGIDLLAFKSGEILLIQCKNWKYPPKENDLKIFAFNCEEFIKNNPNLIKDRKVRKLFITSCDNMDYGVKFFLDEYSEKIEYMIIPYSRS